jgi:hypothetical protein
MLTMDTTRDLWVVEYNLNQRTLLVSTLSECMKRNLTIAIEAAGFQNETSKEIYLVLAISSDKEHAEDIAQRLEMILIEAAGQQKPEPQQPSEEKETK